MSSSTRANATPTLLTFTALGLMGCDPPDDRVLGDVLAGSMTTSPALVDSAHDALPPFRHDRGAHGDWRLEEIMSGGAALFDADRDGDLDLFLVHGAPGESAWCYAENDGSGQFMDQRTRISTSPEHYGMGCAAGDFDGDGWIDLYVTCVGPDVLLRNVDGRTFVDVSEAVGLGVDDGYSSSAVWFDADADGDLDLYVARYLDRESSELTCRDPKTHLRDYCSPLSSRPVSDLLFRNDDGRFVDVSQQAGIAGKAGYGLAVVSSDFDGDGAVDVFVANDQSAAFLWRNQGDGRFEDVALSDGCAYDRQGRAFAGMGVVVEDFDTDRDLDLFVTNIRGQDNLFFRRDEGYFTDVSNRWGRGGWLRPYTGFGVASLDVDHDGTLELYVANGAVEAIGPTGDDLSTRYAEPDTLATFDGTRFVELNAGIAPRAPDIARGVAAGDVDGDGDVDLVVARNGAAPRLLLSQAPEDRHWLAVSVVDTKGAPLLNSLVEVHVDTTVRVREVRAQESYLSTRDPQVHFGLADGTRVDRVVVRFPGGRGVAEVRDVAADQVLVVRAEEHTR